MGRGDARPAAQARERRAAQLGRAGVALARPDLGERELQVGGVEPAGRELGRRGLALGQGLAQQRAAQERLDQIVADRHHGAGAAVGIAVRAVALDRTRAGGAGAGMVERFQLDPVGQDVGDARRQPLERGEPVVAQAEQHARVELAPVHERGQLGGEAVARPLGVEEELLELVEHQHQRRRPPAPAAARGGSTGRGGPGLGQPGEAGRDGVRARAQLRRHGRVQPVEEVGALPGVEVDRLPAGRAADLRDGGGAQDRGLADAAGAEQDGQPPRQHAAGDDAAVGVAAEEIGQVGLFVRPQALVGAEGGRALAHRPAPASSATKSSSAIGRMLTPR